jgi:hypothetical protein
VQQPPTAADLLAIVAEVLASEIVPALSGPAQHHARVATSLVGIVERELRLGDAAAEHERAELARLLGDRLAGDPVELPELRRLLAIELRRGMADDPATNAEVWDVLRRVVSDDLAIAKPGHDAWEGD